MHSNVMPPEISGPSSGIPEATVARLPVYLRALYGLAERGISTVASEELAAAAGVNSAKLRKDLSHLGSYGIRGVGYDVDYLVYQVSRTLGLTQDWPVVIVGAGNLGRALANYGGFVSRGFTIAAMLDSDPAIVGSRIARLTVRHVDDLEALVARHKVAIGVLATPASSAQAVCDRLVAAGVTSILNFAPVVLTVPEGVDVRKVDLSIELQILAFHAQRRSATRPDAEPAARGPHRGGHPGPVNGLHPAASRPPAASELAAQA
jgi:redox-sensing transcriptional repressor